MLCARVQAEKKQDFAALKRALASSLNLPWQIIFAVKGSEVPAGAES